MPPIPVGGPRPTPVACSYSRLRQDLQGARDQARVLAGARYLDGLERGLAAREDVDSWGLGWLWDAIERHLDNVGARSLIERQHRQLRSDAQPLEQLIRRVWLPTRKGVATALSHTKLQRPGIFLIQPHHLQTLDDDLRPGDILVGRKNWYLTNVALPGYWPHAILYLGAPDKLLAELEHDPAVQEWSGGSFSRYMSIKHPVAWARYLAGDGGEPYRTVESIAPGVVLNTLEGSAGDALAALRPRLPPLARAQAIDAAFGHIGKPYDYDFDFATDHQLVCTELVWRAYRPAEGKAGLELALKEVAGRPTLAPNEIVRQFVRERGTERQQLDFVAFLDPIEEDQVVLVADEAAFLESPERPKWNVVQP